ncbi:hypothetical protein F4604DRAFT_1686248 [Suillus subluteus]|nr:hypothetical protein F4604DRAFT_1686248 [Suillus subluteus]
METGGPRWGICKVDGWADGHEFSIDGSAEVVGYYVDGCTKTSGPTYWYYFVDGWAEGAVKDLLYTACESRASGFGCQVSIFRTQYLGLGTQWSGLDGWALGVGTQILGFGTQLSGLGFQDLVVRTRWLGLNGQDSIVGTRWLIVETQNLQLIAMFEFQVSSLESWASGFGSSYMGLDIQDSMFGT